MALIGVDNDLDICENMEPTLTSIMPDFEGAGFLAAKMLDKAMRDRRRKTMSCAKYGVKSLVERMSTQDTFKHGRLVSMACEFIRLHSHEGICVRDVVKEVQTSPRILELRFKQILKHSIRDEILLVRIENLKNKLRLTSRPMGELAYQCGFLSQSNAPMLFKKHVGMTMTEYRASCRG